jgi:hypothetical protein
LSFSQVQVCCFSEKENAMTKPFTARQAAALRRKLAKEADERRRWVELVCQIEASKKTVKKAKRK